MVGLAALLGARAVGRGPRRPARRDWSRRADPANRNADPACRARSATGRTFGRTRRLAAKVHQSGHGDVINSWIGPGQNRPITPDQLHQALGPEAVNNLSRLTFAAGPAAFGAVSRSSRCPDKLTPQGRMPDQAEKVSPVS